MHLHALWTSHVHYTKNTKKSEKENRFVLQNFFHRFSPLIIYIIKGTMTKLHLLDCFSRMFFTCCLDLLHISFPDKIQERCTTLKTSFEKNTRMTEGCIIDSRLLGNITCETNVITYGRNPSQPYIYFDYSALMEAEIMQR